MELGEGMKKFFLLGVGAAATTVEKSTEIVDDLVKKGEITVEQGKVFNQELKHNMEESRRKAESSAAPEAADESRTKEEEPKNFEEFVSGLSPEELEELKEEIAKTEV